MSTSANEVVSFTSRHTAGISLSLSRYNRQWFLTFPRAYGMIAPSRILKSLNDPKAPSNEHTKNHFWLNPNVSSGTYIPEEPGFLEKRYIGSTIHELLDAEPKVVRLTGRKRKEVSRGFDDEGNEIECMEVEVLIPDTALLKQCYYCLGWEVKGESERFKCCGNDTFWCSSCELKGVIASSISGAFQKFVRDKFGPLINKNTEARDSLYAYA